MTRIIILFCILSSVICHPSYASATGAASVYMEDLTWMEIRDRMAAGATIAIIPTGGTEQNGPHMATGKHNWLARYTAGRIAKKLGNALVAPVIAFVPEGRISPPEGHMRFPGTFSVNEETFEALLADTAESLKQHGFKLICFIGEHGGSQQSQARVADGLTRKWQGEGARVLHVSHYYDEGNGQEQWVRTLGFKVKDPLAHAGFMDTSELQAVNPAAVRDGLRAERAESDYDATGAMGDSSQARESFGKRLLDLKIDAAVQQIQIARNRAK